MNLFCGLKINGCSNISSKSRRKEKNISSDKVSINYWTISNTLEKMRVHLSCRLTLFQVVVSALVFFEWVPLTKGSPSPAPDPTPVMTFGNNDKGVYSLFPNEDLRTGRRSFREEEVRPIRDRNVRPEILQPYRDRDGRNSRLFRDDYSVGLRRISNYPVTRPIEKYNQILFDDERLNYPARLPGRDRDRDFRGSRYLNNEPGYFNSYRDRNLPYDRHRLSVRPGTASYLPPGSPRSLTGFRQEMRLEYPPRPYGPDDAHRIHVFDPASKSFQERKPSNTPKFGDNVKPGRLLIPGFNSMSGEEKPGPNVFLNHDEYLDFHTKKALAALDAQEKKKLEKGEKTDGTAGENERKDRAKHLLFSPNIGGLRPPVPNTSGESNSSSDEENDEKPEIKSLKVKGVVIKPLAEDTHKSGQEGDDKSGQSSNQPIRIKGIPRLSTGLSSPQDEAELSKGIKSQVGPEMSPTIKQTQGVDNEQNINQISNLVGNFISSTVNPNSNTFFSAVDHSGFSPGPGTETITFTPSTFPDFDPHSHARSLLGPTFQGDTETPPLIFLESQDGRTNSPNNIDSKGKSIASGNQIFVRRVKGQTTKNSNANGTESSKSTLKKSGHDVETTMKVHKSQVDSRETSNDFNLQAESMSSTGVVSKVHAHISNCPKLHGAAEVICDVHIRKRHGISNPQLIVGWKRKFHNATQPDIVLALNKTLAYEEDFHDKFNVTLAPGISPMLRSVLLIRHVAPPDTGNYQCEVSDGENRLKSDTLLFLCH